MMAHWIVIFPLLAFLINILFWRRLNRMSAWVSIGASLASFGLSVQTFFAFQSGKAESYVLGEWLSVFGRSLQFGITIDALSVMMLLVVSIVATLIKIYSIGYMQDDSRYSRYFAYLSLFTASMLGLILADNFILLYIFWEGVGLCSYLLIAFWFEKPEAARAGLKAFITTRIGDTAFLIGIFLLFFLTQSLQFSDLAHIRPAGNETMLTIIALLIFAGAVGKSAQFPLHVWLPDAMEGPTAVSALIHAATMVAAGVYLVARTFPLFLLSPDALGIVGMIGAISALMAATIAAVHNDIKRVLAYSTISQLGLMMLALGAGGQLAGTFHLMTHAFFKALLFLCAGSIIHAVHTQDIRQMGGLMGKMKITGTTFIIGALALAGVPPLSGFWSKDEVLLSAYQSGHYGLFAAAVVTSLLTAFYMARLIFMVLFGSARLQKEKVHESPMSITLPLVILSVFAVFAGLIGSPVCGHAFQEFMSSFNAHASGVHGESAASAFIVQCSLAASVTGITTAFVMYMAGGWKVVPEGARGMFRWLHRLWLNKYFIDEIYQAVFIRPFLGLCRLSFSADRNIVDGLVNAVAALARRASTFIRPIQTGVVQNYLLIEVLGVIALVFFWGRTWLRF